MVRNRLTQQQSLFYDFLSECSQGDVIPASELLERTGWKHSTLKTYERKHNIAPFLRRSSGENYLVLKNGLEVSKADIAAAFTQVREEKLVLIGGLTLTVGNVPYALERKLGEGAVAHVWKATSRRDSNHYALKIMNPRTDLLEPTVLDNVKRRFKHEAGNGLRLDSPFLVKYLGTGEHKGHPIIVMELADSNLMEEISTKKFSLAESVKILLPCASGLVFLHTNGLYHRDVKPHNILRLGDRYVLGDLGIVKWSDFNSSFTSAATLTHDSVQLGSWYYMAPEQRKAPSKVNEKCDIYALGITWYQMLTGTILDPSEVGAGEFTDPTDDLEANSILRAMLSYSPKKRPTPTEFLEWLMASKT